MSVIHILLAAEAANSGKAVRRTAYRHRSISPRPFVVAAYNLSGEAAAPLGFCFGTSPDAPSVTVAAEPRNRDSRFGAINSFAAALVEYLRPFLQLQEIAIGRGSHRLRVAMEAPQIVVPNRATRDYLGVRLGRSLRYLGLGSTHEVPEATQWAGAHLSWLAEHAHFPGQAVFLAATELLGELYVTGQSELENENLATLLEWIDNDPRNGAPRIDQAERTAYGPTPDPNWEVDLEPHVKQWTTCQRAGDGRGMAAAARAVEARVGAKLREAYSSTWHALAKARETREAPSVSDRWEMDKRHWGAHARRAERGIPRFARRHDALRAARMLEEWSRALERLEFHRAIDDPLVLAELDAAGRCVSGRVQRLNLDNHEVKAGNKRATQVPLVDVELETASNLLEGDSVIWTTEHKVHGEIRSINSRRASVAILGGHKGGTRLPARGSDVVFAALSTFGGLPPEGPEDVPWTHRPPGTDATEGAANPAGDASADGTPDLPPEEILELPLVGQVAADDVPGVVL